MNTDGTEITRITPVKDNSFAPDWGYVRQSALDAQLRPRGREFGSPAKR